MMTRALGRLISPALAIALVGASAGVGAPAARPADLARVAALARDGSKEALAALGTILFKGHDAARQAALDALIEAGETGGMEVLGDFLWKGGWVWRIKVIEALQEWGSPKAIPVLEIAVKDPELRVRQRGRVALAAIRRKMAQAKEAAAQKRLKAVMALLDAKDANAEAKLARAGTDEDPRVRAMAALVLGRLNTAGARDILKTIHVDKDQHVQAAVTWMKMRLAGQQVTLASTQLADRLRTPVALPVGKERTAMPVADCLLRCVKACGASIHVQWDALKPFGVDRSLTVRGFSGQSVTAALDSIVVAMKNPRIDWKAEHDVILISTVDNLIRWRLHRFDMPMDDIDSTPQATRSVRIRMALNSPKQTFKGVRFGQVVEFLREAANADVYIRRRPGLGDALAYETKMSAHGAETSVAGMLDRLLRNQPGWPWVSPAAYTVVDGVVVISSPRDLTAWKTRQRPEGLSTVEAMIVEEIRAAGLMDMGHSLEGGMLGEGMLAYKAKRGGIGWLIATDRPTTTANVLGALDPAKRRRLCTNGVFWSMVAGRRKMARVFLAGGAEINAEWTYYGSDSDEPFAWIKKHGGLPALHIAARTGDPEFVGMMIRAGAKPDIMDESVGTALHVAVERGSYMAAAALVVGGASVDISCKGTRPLHLAAEGGHKKIVALLLDKGARADSPSPGGTPAQRAGAAVKRREKELKDAVGKRVGELRKRIAVFREIVTMFETNDERRAVPDR